MNKPGHTLGFLLHDVARLMRKRFEQNARGLGLTRSQWQVLAHLARNDGIQQGALADLLDVEPITLTRIVDKLETNGMVERRLDPRDRRVRRLWVTAQAAPILEKLMKVGAHTRREALRSISSAEHERLLELLACMKTNLVEALDGADEERRLGHG